MMTRPPADYSQLEKKKKNSFFSALPTHCIEIIDAAFIIQFLKSHRDYNADYNK